MYIAGAVGAGFFKEENMSRKTKLSIMKRCCHYKKLFAKKESITLQDLAKIIQGYGDQEVCLSIPIGGATYGK